MALRRRIFAVVSALWIAPAAGLAGAEPVGDEVRLAPHRAVYDLELASSEARAGLSGASGRMVLEIAGSDCDGWSVEFRIVNDFTLSSGENRLVDSRSSSWEAADGTRLRYSQRQYADSRLESEVLLSVNRDGVDEPGQGTLTEPEEETFTVPPGALFPIAHQIRLLAAARAGEQRDDSTVYDGSDGAKSYQAISFIGERQDPQALAADIEGAEALAGLPSWPVTISYFPHSESPQGEETPSHQVMFDMYDTGAAGDVTLDYGDFALDGKLTSIEMLDAPACE